MLLANRCSKVKWLLLEETDLYQPIVATKK